jgi:hypothetical protein
MQGKTRDVQKKDTTYLGTGEGRHFIPNKKKERGKKTDRETPLQRGRTQGVGVHPAAIQAAMHTPRAELHAATAAGAPAPAVTPMT